MFKQKVMRAMASSGNHPMDGKVDVEETYVGGQDEKAVGRNEGRKQIMVVAVEGEGKAFPGSMAVLLRLPPGFT
jgi:hypothetical protein